MTKKAQKARNRARRANEAKANRPRTPSPPSSFDPFAPITPSELEAASRKAAGQQVRAKEAKQKQEKVGATPSSTVAPKHPHPPIFHISRQGPADSPATLQADAVSGFIPRCQSATYSPHHFIGTSPLPWTIPLLSNR